jgi:hypothetical protein
MSPKKSAASQNELFKPAEYAPTGPLETVVFIRTDNAVALYLRGQLITDGVFLSREMILDALGITHSTHEADDLWWSSQAGALFPPVLSQVKLSKEEY